MLSMLQIPDLLFSQKNKDIPGKISCKKTISQIVCLRQTITATCLHSELTFEWVGDKLCAQSLFNRNHFFLESLVIANFDSHLLVF